MVAWNMSEIHGFIGVLRVAPKSDVLVLVTCYSLTVLFDMVLAVSVGFGLAALLFMRRMAELTKARLIVASDAAGADIPLPPRVQLYEINGPLFFGAAQNAVAALHASHRDRRCVMISSLGRVPVIDSTGLVALDNAIGALVRHKREVVLARPLPRPRKVFAKARLEDKYPRLRFAEDLPGAIAIARELSGAGGASSAPPASPLRQRKIVAR
jgi:SulP family sulfate permease